MPVPSHLFARFMAADGTAALPRRLELVLLALLGVQAGRLLWLLLPVAPVGTATFPTKVTTPNDTVPVIDLFYRTDAPVSASSDAAGFSLHGLRVDAHGGSAILGDAAGKQQSWSVGETIADGVVLERVGAGFVVLRGPRGAQRLEMPASPTAAGAASTVATTLPASFPGNTNVAVEPAVLLTQAGLSPNAQGGYTVNPRGDAAMVHALGLKAGDVIETIDGQPLDAELFTALPEQLSPGTAHTLTVRRDGQTLTVKLPTKP